MFKKILNIFEKKSKSPDWAVSNGIRHFSIQSLFQILFIKIYLI